MMTRAQWDAMTEQQRWDQYCLLVSECGDNNEVADDFPPCGYMDCPLILPKTNRKSETVDLYADFDAKLQHDD